MKRKKPTWEEAQEIIGIPKIIDIPSPEWYDPNKNYGKKKMKILKPKQNSKLSSGQCDCDPPNQLAIITYINEAKRDKV